MTEPRHFPEIMVNKTDKDFEGIACLKLKSILRGDLLVSKSDSKEDSPSRPNPLNPKWQQQAREMLLHAVSSWPSNLVLELHLSALPNLSHKAMGRILITLFIRVKAATQSEVKEELVRRYLSLVPLLAACIPEAEFVPVSDKGELQTRLDPFETSHAVAVHRAQETFQINEPLKRLSLGFGPVVVKKDEESKVIEHIFSWVPSNDSWLRLIDALLWQIDPIDIIIRLRPGADASVAINRLEQTIRTCEVFLSDAKEPRITTKLQAKLLRDEALRQLAAFREGCFHAGVFILAQHAVDSSIVNLLGKAISGPQTPLVENELFQGGFGSAPVKVNDAKGFKFFYETQPYTISEAACAFRLPSPPMEDHPGLPLKRSRTCVAVVSDTVSDHAIELFLNEHHGLVYPIHIGADDRMRHAFIIGQTGTGKSTLMENMILQDIRADRGLAVIDPHGEMVDSLLGKIPKERAQDVILFDPLDRKRPLGFNLLQWETPEERDLIIDELYIALDRIYDMRTSGGPIFESNFRGMLKLLMGEKTRGEFIPTILEFTTQCH